jgi:acetyl esterase/lipase
LRHFAKRGSNPEPDIAALRRRIDGFKPFIPGPAHKATATHIDAGGVPAVQVAMPQSRASHHVLYLHGGAYTFGSPSHYRDFIWRIAAAAASTVLCIDYRLAPEHPFPAALEDAVRAYGWLLRQGAEPSRIAVMGDSAGGGLVFALLLKLRDDGLAMPGAAVAMSPWTDLTMSGNSFRRNANADPMLSAQQARHFARCYLAGADPSHPYASPVFGDPHGLPPSLIQVGSDEILLDDATRMAERLRAAGCSVELEIWPRMPHVWPLFARILPEGHRAIERIGDFVRG